ncbi:MAG: helix-turn-helix transcriptional regulator, partial [Pseudohongiella sp.]
MKSHASLMRQSHFLGTKIRNLRKQHHLTLEDLSARCIKIDPEAAPSVSYISMIERGKRVPGKDMLTIIAAVFQKEIDWFMDDAVSEAAITPVKSGHGGISGMALEPGFLFSDNILQIAIPEMLAQTGTTGRQFAHLLIRAHQEHHRNHFPDLERAAEDIGLKRMPLHVDDLMAIVGKLGLTIKWFTRTPKEVLDETGARSKSTVRSFFDPPGTLYLNELLKAEPARLKYDLALHIGHCTLHNKDGLKSVLLAGRNQSNTGSTNSAKSFQPDAQD